ncbi:MAG: hypothetical protein IJ134_05715 [Bacilli bacterium]|nr:hypothetical protein [Bacilli bacterium]
MKKNIIKIGAFLVCICFIIVTCIFLVNSGTLDLRMLMGNSLNDNYYCEPGGNVLLTGNLADAYSDAEGNYFIDYNGEQIKVKPMTGDRYFTTITNSNYQIKGDKCIYTTETIAGLFCNDTDAEYSIGALREGECVYYSTHKETTNTAEIEKLLSQNQSGGVFSISSLDELTNSKMQLIYSQYPARYEPKCAGELVDSGNTFSTTDGNEIRNYTDYNCKKIITNDPINTYICPGGYKLSGTKCTKTTTVNATKKYSCSVSVLLSGYKINGSKCTKTTTVNATKKYNCPTGYKLNNTKCIKGKSSKKATIKYSCPSGYKLSGTKCIKTLSKSATVKYSCPSGYKLSGTKCTKILSKTATIKSNCLTGFSYNLAKNKCEQIIINKALRSFSCDNGDTLLSQENGNLNCIKNSITVDLNQICGSNQTLTNFDGSGWACSKFKIAHPSKCPKDYILSEDDNICIKTETKDAKSLATGVNILYNTSGIENNNEFTNLNGDLNILLNAEGVINITAFPANSYINSQESSITSNDSNIISVSFKDNVDSFVNNEYVYFKANNIGNAQITYKAGNIEKTFNVNVVPVKIDDKPFMRFNDYNSNEVYGESDEIDISSSNNAHERISLNVNTNLDGYKTVRYRSSNPDRFTVDSTGLINPVSIGEAYLVACVGPNDTDYCKKIKINVTK